LYEIIRSPKIWEQNISVPLNKSYKI